MAGPYFPVNTVAMRAGRHFQDLDGNPLSVARARITSVPLNYPQGCVAYRIEAEGGVFVFAAGTEPGSPYHDEKSVIKWLQCFPIKHDRNSATTSPTRGYQCRNKTILWHSGCKDEHEVVGSQDRGLHIGNVALPESVADQHPAH
jgi:hypothetical protein